MFSQKGHITTSGSKLWQSPTEWSSEQHLHTRTPWSRSKISLTHCASLWNGICWNLHHSKTLSKVVVSSWWYKLQFKDFRIQCNLTDQTTCCLVMCKGFKIHPSYSQLYNYSKCLLIDLWLHSDRNFYNNKIVQGLWLKDKIWLKPQVCMEVHRGQK